MTTNKSPLFRSNHEDLSFFPIHHHKLHEFYEKLRDILWTPNEVQYKDDSEQFPNLKPEYQKIVTLLLALFAQADGLVGKNLRIFKEETSDLKENVHFYSIQEYNETIHNEAYSSMIVALIEDIDEQKKLFNAIENFESIQNIAQWAFKWMNPELPLMERLIAFICIEGIIFQSAFACVYYLKKKNLLPAFVKINEWIARDEAIHTSYGIGLYHIYTSVLHRYPKVTNERIHEIISSAVKLNVDFIDEALEPGLIGLEPKDLLEYVKCISDKTAESLGATKIYFANNPFIWISVINLPNKSNFFESVATEYNNGATDIDYNNDDDDF